MKKFIVLLIITLLFFVKAPLSFADTTTPAPSPSTMDTSQSSDEVQPIDAFIVDPPQVASQDTPDNYISDFTPTVKISFPGLDLSSGNYMVCMQGNYCVIDPNIQMIAKDQLFQLLARVGAPDKSMANLKKASDVVKDNSITVCGDGSANLKTDCKADRDYFHGGNFYYVTIFSKSNNDVAIARGGFYVSHGRPKVTIEPNSNLSINGTRFKVSVSQSIFRPAKDDTSKKNRNNYQVVLEGPGYHKEECDWLDQSHNPRVFDFPLSSDQHYTDADKDQTLLSKGFTTPGKYLFKISEQNNEGRGHTDDCQGGFTYMSISCTISNDPKKSLCKPQVNDPNNEDATQLLNLLNVLGGTTDSVQLPCNKKVGNVTDPMKCNEIDTAIGTIQLDPIKFISRLMSIVLSLASVGAIFLIIFSAYRLLISRGDKEKIQGARQTLTAAIVGLLFIIFSLVLLSVIAGDILKIPGFS